MSALKIQESRLKQMQKSQPGKKTIPQRLKPPLNWRHYGTAKQAAGRVPWDFRLNPLFFRCVQNASTSVTWKISRPHRDAMSPCSRFRIADSESFARSEEKLACSPP